MEARNGRGASPLLDRVKVSGRECVRLGVCGGVRPQEEREGGGRDELRRGLKGARLALLCDDEAGAVALIP